MGLPVLCRSPLYTHTIANTPAEPLGARVAHFPSDGDLPRITGGSTFALPFSRPAQRSLMLRPACSPSPKRTLYTEGFDRFFTSTAAPIATDWSDFFRVGFSSAEEPRLCTAHCYIWVSSRSVETAPENACGLGATHSVESRRTKTCTNQHWSRHSHRLYQTAVSANRSAASRPGSGMEALSPSGLFSFIYLRYNRKRKRYFHC